jgi:hypothetical protein
MANHALQRDRGSRCSPRPLTASVRRTYTTVVVTTSEGAGALARKFMPADCVWALASVW